MPTARIQLLGDFQLFFDNQAVTKLSDQQKQAFVAYLVRHHNASIKRLALGQCLWPDRSPAAALSIFNDMLEQLLHHVPDLRRFLTLTTETLAWKADASFRCDVIDFEEALTGAQAAIAAGNQVTAAQELLRAAQHYRGPLLPTSSNEWICEERSRLHALYIAALEQLAPLLEQGHDYRQAVTHARVLRQHSLRYEPLHRRLAHLYVLSGGRASLLQTLEQRLDATVEHKGVLVLIQGAAGMGKTALATVCEEQAHQRGARFVVGHCYERGVSAPFTPWQEVIDALVVTEQIDRSKLPEPFGSAPPQKSAYQLAQAVTAQLHAVAAEQPLVLLLDDLHWADQDSLDLLEFATRHLTNTPVMILVTFRSEEVYHHSPLFTFLPSLQRNRPTEFMNLESLVLDDTRRLVEAYHGNCSPPLARYLHARAEGHPLFLVQLLQDLVERDLLVIDRLEGWLPPAQAIAAPTQLQQVISARVARLGAQTAQFLEIAAVIGETWQLAIVETMLGWPEEQLLTVLEQALKAGVIVTVDAHAERYRFGHGLIREVLYNRQLARRRKQYHGQIAVLLARQEPADIEALAHHYYYAEQWSLAYHHSLEAGDVAQQRYAAYSALQFYQQALNALRKQGDIASTDQILALYERLGKTYAALSYKEEAAATFAEAVNLAGTAGNLSAQGHALIQLSVSQDQLYQHEEAVKTSQEALRVAEIVGDPQILTLSHLMIGRRHLLTGDLAEATRHLTLAESFAHTAEKPAGLLAQVARMQIYLMIFDGAYIQAEQLTLSAIQWAKEARLATALAALPFQLGYVLTQQGRYDEANQVLQTGFRDVEQLGERHQYLSKLLNMLGALFYELGDLDGAVEWSQRALVASRHEDTYYNAEATCYALLDLATSHIQQGRLADAEAYAKEFTEIQTWIDYGRYRPFNRYQLLQAELALARGEYDLVLQHTEQAAALAREKNFPKNQCKSLLYAGQALLRLQRPQAAAERLAQAVAIADQIGHAALRWQTRLRLAESHTMLDRPSIDLYQQASAMVDALAANLQDPHLRSCFLGSTLVTELRANARAALAAKPTSTSPTATSRPKNTVFPAGLTAREVEVLCLVTAGFTNRQIAEQLHLSVGTVNTHLTNILNKIGAQNRTAAAAFAMQHGLVEPNHQ